MHLHVCNQTAVKCIVPGTSIQKKIILGEEIGNHVLQAAETHYELHSAEIQRLRRVIHEKVTGM